MKLNKQQLAVAKKIAYENNKPLRFGIKLVMKRASRQLKMTGSTRRAQPYFLIER